MGVPSSGRARFHETVRVRSGPSTSSSQVATYYPGEEVNYDSVVQGDGRTWISYISSSGVRRYCCAIDTDGSQYITVSGSPAAPHSPPPSSSGFPLQHQFSGVNETIRKEGCLFLAVCWLGGLNNMAECLDFWNWCVRNGKVKSASDAYMMVSGHALADECARMWKRSRRAGSVATNSAHSHWWVVDGDDVVYNSSPGRY